MRGQGVSSADNEDLFDEAHWTTEVGGAGGGAQNKTLSESPCHVVCIWEGITSLQGLLIGHYPYHMTL